MTAARDRKLYLGPRVRLLRRELGLNQTEMAAELGISPSYLNHLERNQRPLTAQMLLRLADTYDLDMRGFVAGGGEGAAASDLHEVFADALLRDIGIARQEVLEVAENYPSVADAIGRLYRALVDLRQVPHRVAASDGAQRVASPLAWVRSWLDASRNHFDAVDAAAEDLSATLGADPDAIREGAVGDLVTKHEVGVRVIPGDVLTGALTHYDSHRRRLLLSERLEQSSRIFAILAQLARLELAEPIEAAIAAATPPDAESAALARQAIIAYAAAAILMPYGRFHAVAVACRFDLDLLAARFGASYEQVAHRLTTLARQGARGPAMFLLKVDAAGNVAKRFASETAPFTRFGGGCPRWRVHRAVQSLGDTVVDRVEMPDGARYLTWSRAKAAPGSPPELIVLGCADKDAGAIGYGDSVTTITAIGPACHLCERRDCRERSLPPIAAPLDPDLNRRHLTRFPFRPI